MPARRAAATALPAPRLAAALADGLPPVVVLAGAERHFREAGLREVVRRALPEGDPGGSYLRVDAKRAEDRGGVLGALDEVRTASLFGGGKVVAIDHPEAAEGPWVTKERKNPIAALALSVLDAPVPGAVLVLVTPKPVKGSGAVPTAALAEGGALVVDCRALYDAPAPWERGRAPHDHELARHLVQRMREAHGKRIDARDAHLLSRLVGSDLSELEGALSTLALYVGERAEVREADVSAALGATRSDPAWRVTDALLEGDLGGTLDLLAQAFERGIPDGKGGQVTRAEGVAAMLLAALHGTWRRLLGGAEGLARGDDPSALARSLGIPAFRAEAFLGRCRRDPDDVLARHAAFLEAERGLKGGGVAPRLALERLVVRLLAP
jgi:DNA polymerase III delta subunit